MSRVRIIVAEDERDVAEFIQGQLTGLGYSVAAIASSGEEAIQRAAETQPDLVLMKIRLRGELDGVGAARLLKSRFDLPVILLADYADEASLERATVAEFFGCLFMPFDDQELHQAVEGALQRKRRQNRATSGQPWSATLIDCMGDAVIAVDGKRAVMSMNPAAESLIGWPEQEAVGRSLSSICQIRQAGSAIDYPPDRVLRDGVTVCSTPEIILLGRRGIEIPIDDTTTPIWDERGGVIGAVLVFRDLAGRRRDEPAVRQAEERTQLIIEAALDAFVAFNSEGVIVDWNRQAEVTFGWSRDEAIGRQLRMTIIPEQYWEAHERELQMLLETDEGSLVKRRIEMIAKDRTGRAFPVELTVSPLRSGDAYTFNAFVHDISKRQHAVAELKASKEYARSIIESSLDMIIAVDRNRRITEFNKAAQATFGYRLEEVMGRNVQILWADPEEGVKVHQAILEQGACAREVLNVRKNGERFPSFLSASVLRDPRGEVVGVMGVSREITHQKRSEEEMKKSREQLRALAARLVSVRETERTQISRDIHDELGQVLTALKLDLAWLEKRLARTGRGTRAPELDKLKVMAKSVDGTIETVQRIATDLRPGVLDKFGLTTAIEWQAQQFQERSEVRCRCSLPAETIPLDEARSTAIFRIFQEALTNVARHANATRVDVEVKVAEDTLLMTVRDDGRGIAEKESMETVTLGLLGMQERAMLFGGEVSILGTPGEGTTLLVRIPLGRNRASN
jgi:PAS domain S-box-containing protein